MKKQFFTYAFLSIAILIAVSFISSCKNEVKDKQTETDTLKQVATEFEAPEWTKDAVIYEVNIRQYTPEGTLKAFEAHLPRLSEMGVDILWLMPIFPISKKNRKGTLGSYYAVQDYKAVNPDFGTMEDFKALVNKAHDLGMYLILDWVPNHTGWDNAWITEHPDWYTQDENGNIIVPEGTDWTDVADLNYDNKEMRAAMIDALKFWITEANIDGYRCDVAGQVPNDFWAEVRPALEEIKNVFMLAEHESTDIHESFDMSYAWSFHHYYNEIAKGHKTAYSLDSLWTIEEENYDKKDYRMHFITNHDENSWNGTIKERMGDAGQMMAVLTYAVPSMPLIYSGQEAGLDKRLEFFEKDEIDWSNIKYLDFYKKLNILKAENESLWNGAYGGSFERMYHEKSPNVFAFFRTKNDNIIVCFFNFADKTSEYSVNNEELYGEYTDYFSGENITINKDNKFKLDAWAYKVLIKN